MATGKTRTPGPAAAALCILAGSALIAACADSTGPVSAGSSATASTAAAPAPAPAPGTLGYDRSMWHDLLANNSKLRRTVRHTQQAGAGGVGTVEAITESDDPVIAAKIIDHARAMQARMVSGSRVRNWDPVFADLFNHHSAVTIEVTPTAKGVKIVESSSDPEAIALMRAHAMGVSAFVREGGAAAMRETPRFKPPAPGSGSAVLPPPELAIGGVPHRFILSQPDAAQLEGLRAAGVAVDINFRKASEHQGYDEKSAAAGAGLSYCNIPYFGAAEVTDEVIDASRAAIKAADDRQEVAALHCRTGNRIGPGWAASRVLDQSVPLEQAMAEARAMQMVDPLMESKTRDYIRRNSAGAGSSAGAWSPVVSAALTPAQQAQRQRALEARDAMFARLMAALGQAMSAAGPDGGAAGAIATCKEQAPKIAQAVAAEKGVMIGRTGVRLRNTANIAPVWAAPLLADSLTEPRLAANPDGSLGLTLPIRLAANCLACHGAADQIDPAVKAALAAQYPKDQATGFKEGDLRGWFWVEVPPVAAP